MTITEQPGAAGPDRRASEDGQRSITYVSQTKERRESLSIVLFALGALVLAVFCVTAIILGAVFFARDSGPFSDPTVLEVELSEFSIDGELVAPAGEVILNVTNRGSMAHNIGVRELDLKTRDFGATGATTLDLGELEPGVYELYCDIPGHEGSGMVSELTIVEAGTEIAGAGSHGSEMTAADYKAMDEAMMNSILAFPAETEGRGNPILAPTEVLADGTKVFDLIASIVDWEVEPGRFVEAWTYNEVVPAPQILLDRGDNVQVRLVNNLPMGTDIHWHGVHTPNDQDGVAPITQDLIQPGDTYTYEFTAVDDAIGMYHAHNHAQVQVINGMFGVITIGDNPIPYGQTFSGVTIPEDLELAIDEPMILNDAGTIGLSLNGKSFPATEPLSMKQGDWASITYYNEGLQIHPMHLHQFPQLVYAKDGIPLDHPYWVDTLNVAPGERYTVLFRADDAGVWVWHCHILSHVEREEGMFGMVTAIVVEADPTFDASINPVVPTNWRNTAGSASGHDHDHGDS